MNFFLALIAAIFYALQAVLMAKIARSHNALFAQALRGISFGITMLPIFFIGIYLDQGNWAEVVFKDNIYLLLLAIFFAGLANWCIALANTLLPVAYGSTIGTSITTIVIGLIGVFYFLDDISSKQALLIVVLILANLLFFLQKEYPKSKQTFKPVQGYISSCFFGIFIAIAFSLVAKLSRETHPFIIAFLWEFGIGIFLCILMYVRKKFTNKGRVNLHFKTFKIVALYSSPTVVGTATYAYALKLGPLATVGAVQSSVLIFIAIFSAFIFHEKLTLKRWVIIFFIFFILFLIKVL